MWGKYKARKVVVDGIEFDSKKEAGRYAELRILQKSGKIQNLQTQVPYTLIPSQKGLYRSERPCKYVADFVYESDGETIVEDTKGYRTPEYIIKRKLMLMVFGISVKEV